MVYVDGFNLYYGALKGTPHRWLDLETLFDTLLPQYDVIKIRYFTAQIRAKANPADLKAPERQKAYLSALESLSRVEVIRGNFMIHKSYARRRYRGVLAKIIPKRISDRSKVPIWKVEEKGSDVNLGAYLVLDAARKASDLQFVVTSDSDLAHPLKLVTSELGSKVALCFPHGRHSKELGACKHEFIVWISDGALAKAQLPSPVKHRNRIYHRPASW